MSMTSSAVSLGASQSESEAVDAGTIAPALLRGRPLDVPELAPLGDIFVAHLERLLRRQTGFQRLDVGRRIFRLGDVRARRAPPHGLGVGGLAFLREQIIEEELGGVGMRRALEDAGG